MIVIGISGRIGHGKDAIVEHLVRRWGFVSVRFSAALKTEVMERLPRTLQAIHAQRTCLVTGEQGCRSLACVYAEVNVLKPPIVRELLQEYGTEVRRADDPDYWVKQWRKSAEQHQRIAVPDIRFPNEYAAVRELGGKLWRVVRPEGSLARTAAATFNLHESETAVDNLYWDAVLQNDADLDHLHKLVDELINPY